MKWSQALFRISVKIPIKNSKWSCLEIINSFKMFWNTVSEADRFTGFD